LLDSGRNCRYNARDAVWWYLQSLQDYCVFTNDLNILRENVRRRFPTDSFEEFEQLKSFDKTNTLAEIVVEIMQKHFEGIHFREWKAGKQIDENMTEKGFQIDIYTNKANGFVYGGNKFNCGTWMDKMGESVRAGNKGIPSTPRDGADVEIVGLLKSTLRWLAKISPNHEENGQENGNHANNNSHENHKQTTKYAFPFAGVHQTKQDQDNNNYRVASSSSTTLNVSSTNGNYPSSNNVSPSASSSLLFTWGDWNDLIQKNFEKYFFVPEDPSQDEQYEINKSWVNK
jgi:glycogen debranching enzyme